MAFRTITRDDLKQKIERGDRFVLIEVLEPTSYERGHVPGAINVPWNQLGDVPSLVPDRQTEVVLYCASPT